VSVRRKRGADDTGSVEEVSMSSPIGLWSAENVNIKTILYDGLAVKTAHLFIKVQIIKVQTADLLYYAIIHCMMDCIMEKQTVSFRLASDKVSALDELADSLDRDRTYLLGEAVQAYLDTQTWQLQQIRAGVADADAGRVIDHRKVKAMATRWKRRK
jgi:predicted transcriptional regulator